MADRTTSPSIQRGLLEKPRLYLGKNDTELDLYQMPSGQVAASTIADHGKAANEDSAAIVPIDDDYLVLIVADGVGGMSGARKASNLTIETIKNGIANMDPNNGQRLRPVILDGIEAANRAVLDLGTGSASTLALAEIGPGYIRTYHVGDSILMLCGQRGRISLQTTPHSPVGFAMEAGLINETEALQHSELTLIFNVIGSADMRIEIGSEIPMADRDTLLLASDGLTDNALAEEMVAAIRKGPLDQAIVALTELAQGRMRSPVEGQPSKPDDFTTLLYRRTPPRRRKRRPKPSE